MIFTIICFSKTPLYFDIEAYNLVAVYFNIYLNSFRWELNISSYDITPYGVVIFFVFIYFS